MLIALLYKEMLIEKIVSSLYIFYLFNTSFTHADSMQRKEKEIFSRRSLLALQGKQSFLKSEIWRRLLNNPDSANISRRDSHYSERFDSFNKKVYKRSKKKNKTLLKVHTKIRKRPFIAHRNASKILKAAVNKKKHIVGREKKISTSTMTQDGEETTSMITEEIFSSTVHGEITSETTKQNQDDADISDSKSDKESMFLEDRSFEDGDEKDDIFIESGSSCDRESQQTCWFERQVGDILTLETNIIGSNGLNSSFIIRWSKLYHKRNRKRPLSIEITHERLPWNMVLGSGGRELRLNPVTNTDLDPNALMATVYRVTKKNSQKLYQQGKDFTFRIDVPAIEMGKIYLTEEIDINIENYLTLPEKGNLYLDWALQKTKEYVEPLPSNFKVSSSGRSVLLKGVKKDQTGILRCIIYSSKHVAVAKRTFNLTLMEAVKERSAVKRRSASKCRHFLPNAHMTQMILESSAPLSRKKRLKRTLKDCTRLVRSLFGQHDATLDPRVKSVETLIELSDQIDEILDNHIPREIHYVQPTVRLIQHDFLESSVDHLFFSPNCSTSDECGEHAICIVPRGQKAIIQKGIHIGYCFCGPDFVGDGFVCSKASGSNHYRHKRIRRDSGGISNDFGIQSGLFYASAAPISAVYHSRGRNEYVEQDDEVPADKIPNQLAFDEEESYLLSSCLSNSDCSIHAACAQHISGHPYCRCKAGYRGNGIFCWEIIDFVPPEEQITD